MFSPATRPAQLPPRSPSGLRRGGPVLVREVLPAALALLHGCQDAPVPSRAPDHPRTPPLPRAA